MKKIIVANWKMNGNKSQAIEFFNKINKAETIYNVVLCLPFPYLYIGSFFQNKINLGAQNCHQLDDGAYTGEISPAMLADMNCKHVILGHSERRINCYEDNNLIRQKSLSAIKNNLTPIICIGEKKRDDNHDYIIKQCEESLCHDRCVIAYEPVWAIGTNITPTIDEIKETTSLLKKRYDMPVIYGGSVNIKNAPQIMQLESVSGLLIGKASLDIESFLQILQIVN